MSAPSGPRERDDPLMVNDEEGSCRESVGGGVVLGKGTKEDCFVCPPVNSRAGDIE